MIKHLHTNNTRSNQPTEKKPAEKTDFRHLIQEVASDLLQPREQAVSAILAKAAAMKLV